MKTKVKMEKKLYLKIENFKGYDDYYIRLDSKDKTWKNILDTIERVLDDKFLDNEERLDGIKLNIEITSELSEDIEFEEE